MTSDIGVFEHIQPHQGVVGVGGGGTLLAEGIGSVLLNCILPDGTSHLSRLNAVLYIPTLGHSLVSWNVLKSKGYVMAGAGDVIVVSSDGNPVLITKFIGGLPFVVQTNIEHSLISTVSNNQPSNNQSPNQTSDKTQKRPAEQAYSPNKRGKTTSTKRHTFDYWHKSLGHSSKVDNTAYDDGQILPPIPLDFTCESCIMAKSTNTVPPGLIPGNRTTKPFELIYSDLSGKQPIPSYGNSLYYITFIDDYTRIGWIFFLKNKSDAAKTLQEFVKYAERQFKTTVLSMMTDNGGEYMEVSTYLTSQGIKHIRTPPYSHQSNGVAERYNHTIQTIVRSMLIDLNPADNRLWAEACRVAVYV